MDGVSNSLYLQKGFFFQIQDYLTKELKLLDIKRSIVPLSGILKIHQASQLTNAFLEFFEHRTNDYSSIQKVFSETHKTNDIIDSIEKVIDPNGKIKDHASAHLKSIRASIKDTQRKIHPDLSISFDDH